MTVSKHSKRRLGCIGVALGALIAVAATAGPAAADHRDRDRGYFSFGYSAPAYRYYSRPHHYYYPPPPPAYYYPPPAYYAPPPRYYDPPGASFHFVVPFRD